MIFVSLNSCPPPVNRRPLSGHFAHCLLAFCALISSARAADLTLAEQQAIQKAVAVADPSIVRIETVGGRDLVEEVLTGTGPTTGVVVRADGYLLTSRFNFLSNPSSVMVTLADGRRFAAEIVSSDLSRMLTLLKIQATDLTPLVPVPKHEVQVGQWAIALGRTFDPGFPNLSVGIVSALNRVWGRALQTDAKTSPVNYGGPLIDLSGRCLGIIVPLSPDEQGETAGVEWYDSGIGFAVPLVDIEAALPRLIRKETLKPGLMGVGFEDHGPISGAARIIRVRPESPADRAGLQVDDVITELNRHPIQKLNDLKHLVGSLYAGDEIELTFVRGKETLHSRLTLTDELKAYEFPYLGILPDRSPVDAEQSGVKIRTVLPDSPAAKVGLKPGDRIRKVGKAETPTAADLRREIHRVESGSKAELTIQRGPDELTLQPQLVRFPDAPPGSLAAVPIDSPETPPEAKTGRFNQQLPDDGLSFWAYVPENYRSDQPFGLLVWLHPPGDTLEAECMQAWGDLCHERGLILIGPRAGDVSGWSSEQEPQVREAISWVQDHYRIDPSRIAVMAPEGSAVFACKLAFRYRDLFRGLILLGASVRATPPDSDPDTPLQVICVSHPAGAQHKRIVATVAAMQKRNFPAWLIELKKADDAPFPATALPTLAIWLDALDRL